MGLSNWGYDEGKLITPTRVLITLLTKSHDPPSTSFPKP